MADIEERAKAMGWVPQEEFRGNPDNWVEAERFVELAETSLPHLKGTLKTLEDSNATLRGTVESMKGDMTALVEHFKGAEERAYQKALEDLKSQQAQAKKDGDMDAYMEATEALEKRLAEHPAVTGKDRPVPEQQPGQGQVTEYQAWLAAEPDAFDKWKAKPENSWFTTNPKMFAYAMQMDAFLQQTKGFAQSRSQRLEEMAALVKAEFPDHFENPAKRKGSPVDSGSAGGPPSGGNSKGYADLPEEARKQCDKWTGKDGKGESGTIKGFTREQFLKSFKWA